MKKSVLSFLVATWIAAAVAACSCPAPTPISKAPSQAPTEIPTVAPTEHSVVLPTKTSMATFTKIPTATPTPMPSAISPFRLVPQVEVRPLGNIIDLRAAPDGTLWLVTEEGVGSLHGGTWTLHFSGRSGILAGFDDAGRTWLILDEGDTIAAWDGTSWTTYGPEAGWFPSGLHFFSWWTSATADLVTDQRGWVWLITQRDVRAFDGNTWAVYTPEEIGLAPDPYMAFSLIGLALDGSGNIWAGGCYEREGPSPSEVTGPGARWFNGHEWQGMDSHEVGSGCVTDIEVDAAGNVWVSIWDSMVQADDRVDLWRYTLGEEWTHFAPPSGLVITNIEPRPGGATLWIDTLSCGGGGCGGSSSFLVTDGAWNLVVEYVVPFSVWIDDLAFDATGTVFFCGGSTIGSSAIYRVAEETPELLVKLPTDDSWSRCYIEVDQTGRVWAASGDRLWVYEPAVSE